MAGDKFDIEIKDRFSGGRPKPIGYKDVRKSLTFCFSHPKPMSDYLRLSTDEDLAYQRFLDCEIYFANFSENQWSQITHETFIVMMALAAGVPYKWPDEYEDRWHFYCGWYYGIYAWREAIRRHLHKRAIIDDIDLRIVSR